MRPCATRSPTISSRRRTQRPAQRLPARPAGRSPLDGHRALLVKNAVSTVTIFASAVASYLTAHLAFARLIGRQALTGLTLAHGYDTAFWWTAGIVAGALLRPGPLDQQGTPSQAHSKVQPHKPRQVPPVRHDPAGRNQHMHGCRRKIGSAVPRSRESPGSGDDLSPA